VDRTRRGIFGHGDLDRYSLAEVTALKVLAGLECRKCRKYAAVDIDELTRLHGCQFTLGEVRHLARCRRCGSKLPFVLIRSQAIRGHELPVPVVEQGAHHPSRRFGCTGRHI
jgi:hypothetical protein